MADKWYTDAELAKLIELREAKTPLTVIAIKMGWSRHAVSEVLKNEGLQRKYKMRPKPLGIPRGQKAKVTKDNAIGGVITVRMDFDTHKRFAQICEANKTSMNHTALALIKQFIFCKDSSNDEGDQVRVYESSGRDSDQDGSTTESYFHIKRVLH